MSTSPFSDFLETNGFVALDGGLATELEAKGADITGHLWSAALLHENPSLIAETHLAYLRAGADVVTTASYQASFDGFLRKGFDRAKANGLFLLSVDLAVQARDQFWHQYQLEHRQQEQHLQPSISTHAGPRICGQTTGGRCAREEEGPRLDKSHALGVDTTKGGKDSTGTITAVELNIHPASGGHQGDQPAAAIKVDNRSLVANSRADRLRTRSPENPLKHGATQGITPRIKTRLRPLVAASLGCYGAALADGSEYRGDYGKSIGVVALREWHRERLDVLARAEGVDLVIFETIPCLDEVRAILSLLKDCYTSLSAVICISCENEEHLRSGELVRDFAGLIWPGLCAEKTSSLSVSPLPPTTAAAATAAVIGVGVNCTTPQCVAGVLRVLSEIASASLSSSSPSQNRESASNGGCNFTYGNHNHQGSTQAKNALKREDTTCETETSATTTIALVAYPNSGEEWDATARDWVKGTGFRHGNGAREFGQMARDWFEAGATVIGGCCRTTPAHIKIANEVLVKSVDR